MFQENFLAVFTDTSRTVEEPFRAALVYSLSCCKESSHKTAFNHLIPGGNKKVTQT